MKNFDHFFDDMDIFRTEQNPHKTLCQYLLRKAQLTVLTIPIEYEDGDGEVGAVHLKEILMQKPFDLNFKPPLCC
jgi:hypothetical protein